MPEDPHLSYRVSRCARGWWVYCACGWVSAPVVSEAGAGDAHTWHRKSAERETRRLWTLTPNGAAVG